MNILSLTFQVLMALKMSVVVFWVVTLCILVCGYQYFLGMYAIILTVRMEI
jgi:hypothetical protein